MRKKLKLLRTKISMFVKAQQTVERLKMLLPGNYADETRTFYRTTRHRQIVFFFGHVMRGGALENIATAEKNLQRGGRGRQRDLRRRGRVRRRDLRRGKVEGQINEEDVEIDGEINEKRGRDKRRDLRRRCRGGWTDL